MKQEKAYFYSVHSKYGAGYYSDWDALTQSEPFIGDMEVYKMDSGKAAHDDALAHLRTVQQDLIASFDLSVNWFQHQKHIRQEFLQRR